MDSLTWGVVLKDMVRRNQDIGEARHVRVMADATKEGGFCLQHLCVDIDCAPEPNAPGLMPLLEIVVVTAVRVCRVAIARGRRVAIARGRYRR